MYDFNFEKMMVLLKKNLPYCGEKGMDQDAKILYYYLVQKYDSFRMKDVLKKIIQFSESSAVDVDKILSSFAITKITPSK